MYIGPKLCLFKPEKGIDVYISGKNSPNSNYASFKNFIPKDFPDIIDQTISSFRQTGIPFTWICEEDNKDFFSKYLQGYGFKISKHFWGMVYKADIEKVQPPDCVQEISINALRGYTEQIAKQLEVDQEYVLQAIAEDLYPKDYTLKAFAVMGDPGEVKAVSLLITDQKKSLSVLRLAVVFPKFQKRAYYSSMISKRLEVADSFGVKNIICHAYEKAANILTSHGFKKEFKFYTFESPNWNGTHE